MRMLHVYLLCVFLYIPFRGICLWYVSAENMENIKFECEIQNNPHVLVININDKY